MSYYRCRTNPQPETEFNWHIVEDFEQLCSSTKANTCPVNTTCGHPI